MGKHLVLLGGGHAHLTTLLQCEQFIDKGHRVTLVSPAPHHYYSGMGPGMLGGLYEPHQASFHIKKMAEDRGATFIPASAIRINPREQTIQLDSGELLPYDVVSCNTGSNVAPSASGAGTIFPVKPVVELYRARMMLLQEAALRPLHVVVLGGGPAGVEIAANIHRLLHTARYQARIILIAGNRLLPTAPERVSSMALHSLTRRGITVRTYIRGTCDKEGILLSDGSILPSDCTFVATGIRPSSLFRNSEISVGADGGLLVNRFLQSVDHRNVFGGGDCIAIEGSPLAKVGVYAVRQNPVLFHNLMATLEDAPLMPFTAEGAYMLILNMGNDRGILWKRSLCLHSRLVFFLKDRIDRRFMKKFQVSGESRDSPGEVTEPH